MRQPKSTFSEPFAGRKVYPELDHEPEDKITRDEMVEYKDTVIVFMQIRHIQYHVGHCNSILRERGLKAVDWIDYFGESVT